MSPRLSLSNAQSSHEHNGDINRAASTDISTSRNEESLEQETTPEKTPTRTVKNFKWIIVCASLYISIFLYGLDTTIAADVQGSVLEAFGHAEQLAWVGSGFLLGSVCVILLNGAIYTNFNMKWAYIISFALFEIGSALCGAAPTMAALIIGRVITGAGGCGVYMGCLNYLSTLTSPEERGTYVTAIGLCWGFGAVLGPVVGGAFVASSAGWRFAFYINLFLGVVSAPISIFWLPSVHPVTNVSILKRLKQIDFVGLILGAGVWIFFTIAFTMANGQWTWSDGRTIGAFVLLGVTIILYTLQQRFCIFTQPKCRSFPVHLLQSRSQILLSIGTASSNASLYILIYYIPIYFQFVHNDSALAAAVRLLPYIFVNVFFNLSAGYLLSRIKYYMPIFLVSGIFIVLGSGLLVGYLDPFTPTSYIYGFTTLAAVGTGLTMQIGYAVATIKAPNCTGNAISLQNISQMGGSVIGLVIAGQVFQSVAVEKLSIVLAGQGFSRTELHNAVAGVQSAIFENLTGSTRTAAIAAITEAIQQTFILATVGGAGAAIASLAMKREKLFGEIVQVGA